MYLCYQIESICCALVFLILLLVWMTLVLQLTLYLPLVMTFLVATLLDSVSMWTTFRSHMNDFMWLFVFLYLIWCILFHVLLWFPQNDAYFLYVNIFFFDIYQLFFVYYSLILSWFYIWPFVNICWVFYIQMCTKCGITGHWVTGFYF